MEFGIDKCNKLNVIKGKISSGNDCQTVEGGLITSMEKNYIQIHKIWEN